MDFCALERPARPGTSLGIVLPVGPERVVPLALLGVAPDLVSLRDFLEAGGRILALGDVRVMLPRQAPVGGLDRLVVGVLGHTENLVVVPVFHGITQRRAPGPVACDQPKCSRRRTIRPRASVLPPSPWRPEKRRT